MTQSVADAGFFSLVHEVLQADPSAASDRRGEDRKAFDCVQLIAPYEPGRLPSAGEFRHVLCQDLSPGGMSYIDDNPPAYTQLLVLLGPAPFIIVTAEVAHQVPILEGDRTRHLIGCRFTGA